MTNSQKSKQITNCAEQVIHILGGIDVVKSVLNVKAASVYRFTYERPKGTGGTIPSKRQQPLLEYARANELDLTPSDFFILRDEFTEGAAA